MVYGRISYEEKCVLKSVVPSLLETRGLTLLGGSDGDKERFLSLWILQY
jgi:hypothetical protein